MKQLFVRVVLIVGLSISGTQLLAPETFSFRSADIVIQLTPDIPGGRLALSLGPFGELSWSTHWGPLDLHASFLIRPEARDLPTPAEFGDLRFAFVLRKVPWLLLSGILAGALVALGRPRERQLLDMGIGAGLLLGTAFGLVAISAFTFDASALRDPRYIGPVKDAPRILQLLKEVQADWSGVQRNINAAVTGLERLHDQVVTAAPAPPPQDTTRFLLISDIHNNPLGLLIARELATRFAVTAVLNAGDLTDRGTQPEGTLFERFSKFGLPQIIVAGNHEDVATMQQVRRLRDATVLELAGIDHTEIDGITILGEADPNSSTIEDDPDNEQALRMIPERCERLRDRWGVLRPQIVLVHDPHLGACASDAAEEQGVPLVLAWGHTHKQAYDVAGTVIGVSAGTSGANGFKSDKRTDYGFALLEFDRGTRLPISVCLFDFSDPSALRQTTCHLAGNG